MKLTSLLDSWVQTPYEEAVVMTISREMKTWTNCMAKMAMICSKGVRQQTSCMGEWEMIYFQVVWAIIFLLVNKEMINCMGALRTIYYMEEMVLIILIVEK